MTEFPSRRQLHGSGDQAAPHTRRRDGRGSDRANGRWVLPTAIVAGLVLVALVLGTAAWMQNHRDLPAARSIDGALDHISVQGRCGAPPVVLVDAPVVISTAKQETLSVGAGRPLAADAPVFLAVYAFSGKDGSSLTDQAQPRLITGLANQEVLGADLADLVIGKTEGSRIVVVRPIAGGGAMDATEIDVVDILPLVADGKPAAEADAAGPLSVEMTEAGPLISHQGNPPSGLTVQTLLQGSGAQVGQGDTVVIQYLIQRWSDGSTVGTTWNTGIPESIAIDKAMPGVRNALVDHKVGSRLAVTVPPEAAGGDDTLVAVVDILGIGSTQ